MKDLLIEILVEEIPADFAYPASLSFKKIIENTLKNNGLNFKSITSFTTPRRLSILVEEAEEKSKDDIIESKGPLLESAIKDGVLTKAGEGFLKANNIEIKNIKDIDEKESFNKPYLKELNGKKYIYVKKEKKGIETKKLFIEADRLDHHLYFSDWLEAVLIPCMSMVVIEAFFMDNTRCRIVWMTMAVYSINLMAQDLYMRTRNERSSTVFVWNIQRQAEQYRAYCHSLGEAWERNRRFRHDLKKQYMLERIYLERGEYEKLEQEYDRVIQITSSREVISGHVMTDAILSCKRSEADQRQIGLTVETSIPTDLAISDYHLNMLLGNILDNAIRHTGQGGQIWIKMVYDRQNLLIHCKNTMDECENRSTDSGSSDRRGEPFVPGIKNGVANSEMHGIGLHIMREIVAYYNGTMDIKKTNCEYIVMIILELTYQKLH